MVQLGKRVVVRALLRQPSFYSGLWTVFPPRIFAQSILYRVPGFPSRRPNWVAPLPHPKKGMLLAPPPHLVPRGATHSLAGDGWGGGDPIPIKGQTLWYSMYTIIPQRDVCFMRRIVVRKGSQKIIMLFVCVS